jgi:hypothetical protein
MPHSQTVIRNAVFRAAVVTGLGFGASVAFARPAMD